MAIKKGASGCLSCADGYFKLARDNGATESQIKAAVKATAESALGLLTRRQMLKLSAAGAGALAVWPLLDKPLGVEAACSEYTGSLWWGTHDGAYAETGKPPQNFYLYCGARVRQPAWVPHGTPLLHPMRGY